MKKIDVGQTIGIFANLGVIAGILLLAFEVRQAYQATELEAAQSYMSMAHELDFRLVDDPSTYPLVLGQPEDLTPVDRFRQDRWTFAVLRTWENGYYLNRIGVLDDALWAGQDAFITEALRIDPRLVRYIQSNRNFYSEDFIEYLEGLREPQNE